jgi:hypothetical protein
MGSISVWPQGEDVGVLEHQEVVVVGLAREGVLEREGFMIGNRSQVANPEHAATLDLLRARQPSRDYRSDRTLAPRMRRHTLHRPPDGPS